MAPDGAIVRRRSGRPWGRRVYSALRTPALASRLFQALPASRLNSMTAPESAQGPLCNLRTAWLLPRGTWKLSLESAPGTIPHSCRVCAIFPLPASRTRRFSANACLIRDVLPKLASYRPCTPFVGLFGSGSLDYHEQTEFEWDEAKSEACFVSRKFDFEFASKAFADPNRMVRLDLRDLFKNRV